MQPTVTGRPPPATWRAMAERAALQGRHFWSAADQPAKRADTRRAVLPLAVYVCCQTWPRSRGNSARDRALDVPRHHICGAGGIRTHTGRILSPVPLPLGYGPASALAAAPLCAKSDAEILAQPSDMARGFHRVLCLFDLPVCADYER